MMSAKTQFLSRDYGNDCSGTPMAIGIKTLFRDGIFQNENYVSNPLHVVTLQVVP